MKQAKDWFENDRVNGKMHLCFSYKPKQPSEYAHLEDTKVGYNSILAKFYVLLNSKLRYIAFFSSIAYPVRV